MRPIERRIGIRFGRPTSGGLIVNLILPLFCLFLLPQAATAFDQPRNHASWWVAAYGVADAGADPLVKRAERVFARVCAAADKKANRFPRLVVIRCAGNPWALAIKDGSVILTSGALKLCYRGVPAQQGDSRLAFVLGHELAHLAKDDFWHAAAFDALTRQGGRHTADRDALAALFREMSDAVPGDRRSMEAARMKELQADESGLVCMTMAGYDPLVIIGPSGDDFFREWATQINGKLAYGDADHPTPAERAEFARTQLARVADSLPLFHFGVRLSQLGRHEDAILLFEAFLESFPGREVYNNLGLAHYQLAMRALDRCDRRLVIRFRLPALLDEETLARGIDIRAPVETVCTRLEAYTTHITEAIRYLVKATDLDPGHIPSRLNLASAFIMSGDYAGALKSADEALKLDPSGAEALTVKTVALYLYGVANNLHAADNSITILRDVIRRRPDYPDAFYNLASIQTEIGRNAAAAEGWKAFIRIEPTGLHARGVRERLHLDEPVAVKTHNDEPRPPIPLGPVTPAVAGKLSGLKKTPIVIGQFRGAVYQGQGMRVLVIDDAVELVEEEPTVAMGSSDILKAYGQPERVLAAAAGKVLIRGNTGFVLDSDRLTVIFHFKKGIY